MPRSSTTTLRLLGAFAIAASAERPAAPVIRSRKARALLAYLAMTPDGRAGREELATLLWGDNPDAQARHSLRQCLSSLRQDLHHVAPELVCIERETIKLRTDGLVVDARDLLAAASSTEPDALARAAELWRGPFLADLALDIEEFAAWRSREQERVAGTAARIFESLCASADAASDGTRAVAMAERLVALDPTHEERQRVALRIYARHRGRDAALDRAQQLVSLLRSELDVAPEAATRTLIEAIRNGALFPSPQRGEGGERSEPGEGRSELQLERIEPLTPALSPRRSGPPDLSTNDAELGQARVQMGRGSANTVLVAQQPRPAIWRRRPIAAALAAACAVSLTVAAVLGIATGSPLRMFFKAKSPSTLLATAVVLPFAVDAPRGPDDRAFARLLTTDLTADLTRYGDLRIVSDRAADLDPDRQVDLAAIGAELGVAYAVVGRVQRSDAGMRADVQLIDTATRMTLWSDHVRREPGDAAQLADEVARGLTHALVVNITYAQAQRLHRPPDQPPTIGELLLRAHVAEIRGYRRENVAQALALNEEVLRRAPNNASAKVGIARMTIIAAMNFIDLDTPPDLVRAEALLTEVLGRFPNWAAAHYSLGLLQKYRRQFPAALQSFQRSLEINPSMLHARGQIGALLTRMGQPEKGLASIQETIRLSTPNDPSLGFFYLFAGEAELELGHPQAALAWVQRAATFMPGSPLAHAWLASVYNAVGDQANVARQVAILKKIAPTAAERYAARKFGPIPPGGWPRTRILDSLHLALATPAQ